MPPMRQAAERSEEFAAQFAEHLDAAVRAALAVVHDRQLAEDVAQDVFLDLWLRPDRYDPARGELRPYLRLRARSRALDVRRTHVARARLDERLADVAATGRSAAPDAASRAAERERTAVLTTALGGLPGEQRDAVALAYVGGFTAGDIAAARGVPIGTAKSRVRLGLEKLRASLATAA
jgi:RNA polymerase sigma-70 factor (ECF subfamily)